MKLGRRVETSERAEEGEIIHAVVVCRISRNFFWFSWSYPVLSGSFFFPAGWVWSGTLGRSQGYMKIREALLCIAWMGCDMIWCYSSYTILLGQVLVSMSCGCCAFGSLITLKPFRSWLAAAVYNTISTLGGSTCYIVSHIAPLDYLLNNTVLAFAPVGLDS
jgi:hypothetical protein